MKFLLNWLKEFVPSSLNAQVVADYLNDLGLVVEKIQPIKYQPNIVAARVLDVQPIKGADRIKLAEIDFGKGQTQVVSGAPNLVKGGVYPYGPPGTQTADSMLIEKRRFKGVESDGMLLSLKELGFAQDASGLFELTTQNIGQNIFELCKVENDFIFEVEITPNRGDAMSLLGIARDLAAKANLTYYEPETEINNDIDDIPNVEIEDPSLGYILSGRIIKNLTVKDSVDFIKVRLITCGFRPINNVVDFTNYVMLELGQPSHAYDLNKLKSSFIKIRAAKSNEKITTLDGVTRFLGKSVAGVSDLTPDVVIADNLDNVLGVGGVMGGQASEISNSTKEVLLEVAHFDPLAIARTSRRLSLRSEASVRFERGTDPAMVKKASQRVAYLIKHYDQQAKVGPIAIAQVKHPRENYRLKVDKAKITRILGTEIADRQIISLLTSLGFEINLKGDTYDIAVPTWRNDIFGRNDLAEEVGRLYGYNNIKSKRPLSPFVGKPSEQNKALRLLHFVLNSNKFAQVINSALLPKGLQIKLELTSEEILLSNPLSAQESALRVSLLPGLIKSVVDNINKNLIPVRLYEIGDVFIKKDSNSWEEIQLLGVALYYKSKDDSLKKVAQVINSISKVLSVKLNLERSLISCFSKGCSFVIKSGDSALGLCGIAKGQIVKEFDLTGDLIYLELDIKKLLEKTQENPVFIPSKYPSSEIDLAFVVDKFQDAEPIRLKLIEAGGDLIENVYLFDVFTGSPLLEHEKNLAFSIRLASKEKTLDEQEIASIRQELIKAVEESFSARLR